MVNNIGIDIIRNSRIVKHLNNELFIKRVLSSEEIKHFHQITNIIRKTEYLASRFSGKEALFKALRKVSSYNFSKVSILNDEFGSPYIVQPYTDDVVLISISHERDYTITMVIIDKSSKI